MTDKYEELNKKTNLLFRQLGKEIYKEHEKLELNKKQKNILNTLKKSIEEIEILNTLKEKLPKDAIILEPKKNEDGLMIYTFCPHCQTGNNPESTHCLNCKGIL